MSGFHGVVYFGSDGQILSIPFMYLCIIGCLPCARPLISSIKADRAERFRRIIEPIIEEYPTPV